MAATKVSVASLAILYERARQGESVYRLAKEAGVRTGTLSTRLYRRYGFLADPLGAVTICMPTDPGVLAYLAGLLDAEGSIVRTPYGAYTVSIKMTNRPVIEWLGRIGGRVAEERPGRDNCKPLYTWHIHRLRDVAAFLPPLLPYLRIFHEAAGVALAVSEQRIARRAPRCKVPA